MFIAKDQFHFSELVWWPNVDKQEVLQLRAYIILFFYCIYIYIYIFIYLNTNTHVTDKCGCGPYNAMKCGPRVGELCVI
jgi:hypothetical protein